MSMSALLGTVNFEDVEVYYGYKLTETDKKIWDEYFNQCADFSDAKSSFFCVEHPPCIIYKGESALRAIKQIFTKDKKIKNTECIFVLEYGNYLYI